jgi:hypothetical protein
VNENDAVKPLRVTLMVIGVLFIVALYPLSIFWPTGWTWHATGHSAYLQMIMGVYATLGVFLLRAARNPLENLSLIWFTVWSSIVHGGIMAAQAVVEPNQRGHLIGDVPAMWLIAAVLAGVTLRAQMPGVATRGAT